MNNTSSNSHKNAIELTVISGGDCIFCGRPIKLVVPRGYGKTHNGLVCKWCSLKLKTNTAIIDFLQNERGD